MSSEHLLAITGGAGHIATAVRPFLRARYRLRLIDLRPVTDLTDAEESATLDLSDFEATERAISGAQAVLHLGANPSTGATWTDVRQHNIDATFNVFEAARRNGASKVVFASTNHVVGFENLESRWPIGADAPVRPDSLYGVSKAFGEALARYFADAFQMSMICIRIGWFTPKQPNINRLNPLWISARDLAQLFGLALETPRRFGIYNGTSDNSARQWDLQKTRDELGFAPQDDVAAFAGSSADDFPYVDPQAGILRALERI